MDLQRIHIDIPGNFKFVMEPYDKILYSINEPDTLVINRLAIIYKLVLIDYTLPVVLLEYHIESYTTYYISDGKTNNFRGNLLLPFLCIRDHEKEEQLTKIMNDTSCLVSNISDNHPRGLLYKVNACNHLDFSNIHNRLVIAQDADNKILSDYLKQDPSVGIMSVLPRMSNIVDFLLALSSKKISELNEQYNFVSDDLNDSDIKIKNIKNESIMPSDVVEYNFLSYDEIEKDIFDINIEKDIFDINIYDNDIKNLVARPISTIFFGNMQCVYRRLLIRQFAKWNQLIKNNGDLIKIDYIRCDKIDVNLRSFNEILNVCKNNNYSETSQRQFVDYRKLSNNLNLKIRDLASKNENILNIFREIFIPQEKLVCSIEDLNTHMKNGWKSDCDTMINKLVNKQEDIMRLYQDIMENNINLNNVIFSDIMLVVFFKYYQLLDELKITNNINPELYSEMINMCDNISEKIYTNPKFNNEQKIYLYYEILKEIDIYNSDEKIQLIHTELNINSVFFTHIKNSLKNIFTQHKFVLNLLINTLDTLRLKESYILQLYLDLFNGFLERNEKRYLDLQLIIQLIYGELLLRKFASDNILSKDELINLKEMLQQRISNLPPDSSHAQEYQTRIIHINERLAVLAPERPERPERPVLDTPGNPLSKRLKQEIQGGSIIYKQKYLKYKEKYLELQKMMKNINII